MQYKCPGSNRPISSEIVICRSCGFEVELFSDEGKRSCPKCGNVVFHSCVPPCADWCEKADECIGDEQLTQKINENDNTT